MNENLIYLTFGFGGTVEQFLTGGFVGREIAIVIANKINVDNWKRNNLSFDNWKRSNSIINNWKRNTITLRGWKNNAD